MLYFGKLKQVSNMFVICQNVKSEVSVQCRFYFFPICAVKLAIFLIICLLNNAVLYENWFLWIAENQSSAQLSLCYFSIKFLKGSVFLVLKCVISHTPGLLQKRDF